MAKSLNESQVWHSITKALISQDIKIEHPNDVPRVLKEKQSEYEYAKNQARFNIEQLIQNLIIEIESNKKDYSSKIQSASEKTKLEIENIQASIDRLETSFFNKIINIFEIRKLRLKTKNLSIRKNKYIKSLKETLANKQATLKKFQEHKEMLIENECLDSKKRVLLLERINNSHELAGAIAELELIKNLIKLPDSFIVINDVNLKSKEYIHFDGKWLKSAQIDHVVVGPSGVFVIETKNWSQKFIKSGDYQDPYQQIKRARYMCYKFLEDRLKGAKVRSIIAHNGNIPKKPQESQTKTLHFQEINGYINYHKESILTEKDITDIANRLK